LSAAPQAVPQAAAFSSGLSAAPQAVPQAAGFSSGLSAAPQAVPQAAASLTSFFFFHPNRLESAIVYYLQVLVLGLGPLVILILAAFLFLASRHFFIS
jgi:hypothetical protein